MNPSVRRASLGAVLLHLTIGGCAVEAGAEPDLEPIDLEPATLEEASASIAKAHAALMAEPESREARDRLSLLRDRLDDLNGRVARIRLADDHVVTFYAPKEGAIGVSERAPLKTERVLTDELARQPPVEIYRRLAHTDDIPEALVRAAESVSEQTQTAQLDPGPVTEVAAAPSAQPGERADSPLGVTRAALTAADGQWYRDNICFRRPPNDGVMCLPNWGNGGSWSWNARHSYLHLAHYGSTPLRVRFSYNGGTVALDTQFPGESEGWVWHSASRLVEVGSACWFFACPVERHYDIAQHRYDIEDAAGDGFHWSSAGRWVNPT